MLSSRTGKAIGLSVLFVVTVFGLVATRGVFEEPFEKEMRAMRGQPITTTPPPKNKLGQNLGKWALPIQPDVLLSRPWLKRITSVPTDATAVSVIQGQYGQWVLFLDANQIVVKVEYLGE